MDYIAHAAFDCAIPPQGGTIRHYTPGDVVDDFMAWPFDARQTHLRLNLVVPHDSAAEAERLYRMRHIETLRQIARLKNVLKEHNIDVENAQPISALCDNPPAGSVSPLDAKVATPALGAVADVPPVPSDTVGKDAKDEAAVHACSLCPRTFTHKKSLQRHRAQAHPGL